MSGDELSWLDGRYELGEIIGRGGMSAVYRAHDHRTGRDVAVKIFRRGPDPNDADQRYRREVMLLAALRDPGLVTVYDADLDDPDRPYLVTELVRGPTLSEQIKHAPLTEAQVGRLGAALARTLAYVHSHGIVHRDVKPANILLPALLDDQFAAPKLVDFGIAIATDATRVTGANLTLGTANYLSPEQIRGGPVTPATDVYSLGLVLIEALSGQPVYPGHGIEAAMARLDNPPAVPPTAGDELRPLLTAMTATDARSRPSAAQVADRIDDLNASRATEVVALAAAAAALAPPAADDAGEPGAAAGPAAKSGDGTEPVTHRAGWENGRRPSSWPRTVAAAGALIVLALFGLAAIASFTGHKAPTPVHRTPSPQAAPTSAHSSTPKLVRTTTPKKPTMAVAPPVYVDEPPAPAAPPSSSSVSRRPPSTTTSRTPSTSTSRSHPPATSAPTKPSAPPAPTTLSPSLSPPSLPTLSPPTRPPTPTLTTPPPPSIRVTGLTV